ncbi:MAG: hypothetical protein L0Y70_28230 [Gemmataceae bacterium]|nr:hypothetical protein [Gemmataceae bacterium]
MFSRSCILIFSGLLAFSIGCGPDYKARAVVKGKVTFGGKNLTVGNVMFHGNNNITGSAAIDMNGNYVMNDAPLGDVKITVSVPKLPPGGIAKMKEMAKAFKDIKSVDPEGSGKSIGIMGAMPTHIVPIPEKYSKVETSGLTHKVQSGEHTHDLPLTP